MDYKLWKIAGVCIAAAAIAAAAFMVHRYQVNHRFVFVPKDVSVTIPEGTNLADADRILSKASIIKAGELMKLAATSNKYGSYEGMLFPDTYRFDLDTAPEKVLAVMTENFAKKAGAYSASRNTIIIASLLEKEVKTDQDMRLVAGIIQKRLKLDMALQIDATVAYGACFSKFSKGIYCDVTLASIVDNIHIDSPYNTYSRQGLPVAPISNPGIHALEAASHPQIGDYLYYLSAPDGKTIFSRTAAEHAQARAKYLGK